MISGAMEEAKLIRMATAISRYTHTAKRCGKRFTKLPL
jgi:hypothetical protein